MKFNQTNFLLSDNLSEVKAAVFVAHPDDETIWIGGTILSQKNWNWEIIVATHDENDNRGKDFIKSIEKYRDQYGVQKISYKFIEAMTDEQDYNKLIKNGDDKKKIHDELDKIEITNYNIIFTHNIDGEYGHANHKILGQYFKDKTEKENLNIWHFLCPSIQNIKEKQTGEYIETTYLNTVLLTQKYLIFQYSYESEHYLWTGFSDFMRFEFCSGIEMFTRFKK